MDKRDQIVLQKLESVHETKARADAALISPVTPNHLKSSPELWSRMRKLIFGMLDGSNLDQFGVQKTENGWPVIYRVSSVFDDPSKKTQILNPETLDQDKPMELSWEEIAKYPDFQNAFATKRSEVDAESQKSLSKLVELNQNLESKKLRLDALKDYLEEIQPPESIEENQIKEETTEATPEAEKVVS
jgi:hypothetical protein